MAAVCPEVSCIRRRCGSDEERAVNYRVKAPKFRSYTSSKTKAENYFKFNGCHSEFQASVGATIDIRSSVATFRVCFRFRGRNVDGKPWRMWTLFPFVYTPFCHYNWIVFWRSDASAIVKLGDTSIREIDVEILYRIGDELGAIVLPCTVTEKRCEKKNSFASEGLQRRYSFNDRMNVLHTDMTSPSLTATVICVAWLTFVTFHKPSYNILSIWVRVDSSEDMDLGTVAARCQQPQLFLGATALLTTAFFIRQSRRRRFRSAESQWSQTNTDFRCMKFANISLQLPFHWRLHFIMLASVPVVVQVLSLAYASKWRTRTNAANNPAAEHWKIRFTMSTLEIMRVFPSIAATSCRVSYSFSRRWNCRRPLRSRCKSVAAVTEISAGAQIWSHQRFS